MVATLQMIKDTNSSVDATIDHIANDRSIPSWENFADRYKADVVSAVESIEIGEVSAAIKLFQKARASSRSIFVCGETASAAVAATVVCDMMTRSSVNQSTRCRSMTLHNGMMGLPGDDEDGAGWGSLFVTQLRNFAEAGDIVVGISAGSKPFRILRALEYGRTLGCKTVALTGLHGGRLEGLAEIVIHVGSTHVITVEDTHLIICHMIGSYFLEFDGLRLEAPPQLSGS